VDLGAATTEGDGMTYSALVDTVILWNALARVHDGSESDLQAEALVVLRDGWPADPCSNAGADPCSNAGAGVYSDITRRRYEVYKRIHTVD